jgi:hypothetical protein
MRDDEHLHQVTLGQESGQDKEQLMEQPASGTRTFLLFWMKPL